MISGVAAMAATLATLLAVPGCDRSLLRLQRQPGLAWLIPRRRWRRPLVVLVSAVAASVLIWSGSAPRLALGVLGGGAAAAVVRRIVHGWRQRRERRRRQRSVIGICDALVAELQGGLPVLSALLRACDGVPDLQPVASAARLGGDIPATVRGCGAMPGAEGLRAVAAAWEVAATSGAALAGVLERVGAGLRSDEDARAEVSAALGPPRATAKMLAVLPLAGIAMGESMGSAPLSFLLGSSWGLGCLASGVVLALAGIWWVELLAGAAER